MDFTSVLMILVKQEGARAAIGELTALEAAGRRADTRLGGLARTAAGAGATLGRVGRGVTRGITMPLVGIGVAAGDMAAKFQQAMELVHTQSGASQREVDKLKGKVLDLAKSSKQGPVQLADALYRLEGAGLRGGKAMSALKAASQLAAVGNANVEDTAKTLSQAWFSGIKGAGNFKHVVAELNGTVGAGDLRLQQLVDALGVGILPVARQAGLTFHDITGVMATFGDETNNVSGWSAQLATALHYLYAPSAKAEGALASIGLSGSKLGADMHKPQGLLTALRDLGGHLDNLKGGRRGLQAAQTLAEILPGGRGRVLTVLLNQVDRYQQKLQQVKATTGKFGDAVSKTHETAAFKIGNAWAKVQVALVKFGGALLPVVVPMVQKVAKFIGDLGDKFSSLSPGVQKVIVIAGIVAAALGPVLVALGLMATGLAVLLSPAALVVGALAALAAGLVYAYTHSTRFRQIVTQVAATIRAVFPVVVAWVKQAATSVANFAIGVGRAVKTGFEAAVHWVTGAVHTVVNEVRQWDTLASVVKRIFGLITGAAHLLFDGLKTIFLVGRALLTPIFTGMWTAIKDVFSGAWTAIKAIVSGGFKIIRGVALIIGGLFKGDFRQMWQGIKTIFSGAFQVLKGLLAGAWQILKAPVDGIAAGLHDAFAHTWGRIKDVFKTGVDTVIDFLNVLIKAINFLPGIPDIKPIGHIGGGGGGGGGKAPAGTGNAVQGTITGPGHHASSGYLARGGAFTRTGGIVNRPMTFMGEEAPAHPEYVIPTNPAYRGRARGLLARAAGALGFARGGVYSQDQLAALWRRVNPGNGDPRLMAAIAEAESRGRVYARNGPYNGLWQVGPGGPFDPVANARAAGVKLRTQGLGAWETWTNGAYKQFLGGGGGILGAIGHAISGAVGSVASVVKSILGKFPSPGRLGMFVGLGKYVIGKVTGFVKSHVGSLFGGGASSGPNGVGSFAGVPMANWVAQALQYAQRKLGYALHPTSGYRPGRDPHTASGYSEHSGTQYPHGAVDFGGYHDPAARAVKMAVVNATRGFKWPLLAPQGFADDGHASGTGHKKGGVWGGYAAGTRGARPGLSWVGEKGPELVRFRGGEQVYDHHDSMRMLARGLRGYAKGTPRPDKGRPRRRVDHDETAIQAAVRLLQFLRGGPFQHKGVAGQAGSYTPPAPPSAFDYLDQALAQAQLTATTADDLAALTNIRSYRAGAYGDAVAGGDPRTIAQAARDLKDAQDALTGLDNTATQLADAMKGVQDELKRQTDFAEAIKATSGFQAEKTLTDVLSNHVVGRGLAGRRFTAGTAVEVNY